jgi:hypothetical protein
MSARIERLTGALGEYLYSNAGFCVKSGSK